MPDTQIKGNDLTREDQKKTSQQSHQASGNEDYPKGSKSASTTQGQSWDNKDPENKKSMMGESR